MSARAGRGRLILGEVPRKGWVHGVGCELCGQCCACSCGGLRASCPCWHLPREGKSEGCAMAAETHWVWCPPTAPVFGGESSIHRAAGCLRLASPRSAWVGRRPAGNPPALRPRVRGGVWYLSGNRSRRLAVPEMLYNAPGPCGLMPGGARLCHPLEAEGDQHPCGRGLLIPEDAAGGQRSSGLSLCPQEGVKLPPTGTPSCSLPRDRAAMP